MSRFTCSEHSTGHVALETFRRDDVVAERIRFRCGCIRVRDVGQTLPNSHFDAIERRVLGRVLGRVRPP